MVIDLSSRNSGQTAVAALAAQAALLDEPAMAEAFEEAEAAEDPEKLLAGRPVPELARLAASDPDPAVRQAAARLLMRGNEEGTARLMAAIFSEPNAA